MMNGDDFCLWSHPFTALVDLIPLKSLHIPQCWLSNLNMVPEPRIRSSTGGTVSRLGK